MSAAQFAAPPLASKVAEVSFADDIARIRDMSPEQRKAYNAAMKGAGLIESDEKPKRERQISVNSSGGLYVYDPTFESVGKNGKMYVGSFNMVWEVAQGTFANAELLAAIVAFVESTSTKDRIRLAQAARDKKADREERETERAKQLLAKSKK